MKNILKLSIIVMVSSMLLSSCIKETFPTEYATTEQIAESPTALESMVKAIPVALMRGNSQGYGSGGSGWDFSLPAVHVALESMTGDLVITGNTGYDHFSAWGRGRSLGNNYAIGALTWHNFYSWIKSANDIIKTIGESAENAVVKSYLGAAHAYRAMSYLYLVRMYEYKENKYIDNVPAEILGVGVPIVTETTTEEEAKKNPRAKVEDIYELIFADLDLAETLLAGYKVSDKYTINESFVYGLKARAYLERGTAGVSGAFEKAASYARKAIETSRCTPLTQAQWEDPNTGFNSAGSNNAWILGMPLPSENVWNLFNFTAHMSTEESWTSYGWRVGRGINKLLYEQIPDNDFRKYSWLDPDLNKYNYKSCRTDNHFATNLEPYANIKFRPAQGAYSNYKIGGAADHALMRVEEMYFIEAEATAQSNLESAKSMLNAFMKYRITDGSYDCSYITSVSEFNTELLLQKRIEFWGEGIVLFDMKRHNVSTSRGYKGTNAPANYRLNTDGRAPYWTFTIIRSEENNNTAIVNNPDPSEKVSVWIDRD